MELQTSGLFGTSGIRRIVGVDLEPLLAMRIGLALGFVLKKGRLTLARDTRTSGEMLSSALAAGALSGGLEVMDLGVLPTPVLAYLTKSLGAVSGVMITASHNPPEFNGLKVFDSDGRTYYESLQNQIKRVYSSGNLARAPWNQPSDVSSSDLSSEYIEMVLRQVDLDKKWKVAVDCGSGAAYQLAPDTLRSLHCDTICLNDQPDGFFPGRSPEPTPQSVSALLAIVRNMNCDIGFAYDGDADRVLFVDEQGQCVDGDIALAAFASYKVRKQGDGQVALPIDASLAVQEAVEKSGGRVAWTKVGDANVANAIVTKHAIFGGEPCGAWIHPTFHFCPDGILSSILLLKAIEEKDTTTSEFFSGIKKYPMKRAQIPCQDRAKTEIMRKVEASLPEAFGEKADVMRTDGIRVQVRNGWILVRASGTEPAIRITVEAQSEQLVEDLFSIAHNLCSSIAKEWKI